MRDWIKIDRGSIVKDRTLLLEFSNDYLKHFGKLNIGCRKCIKEAYNKLINFKPIKMKNDCDYILKSKYEGIFFEGKPIRNSDLTNKKAERLLKKHPAGKSLFQRIPTVTDIKDRLDSELKLIELREKYPNITANSKTKFLEQIGE